MDLKLNEKIQLLRKRIGLNQGDFGAQAFNTSFESGRTKMKNIELGKQNPTQADLKKMAAVLGITVAKLLATGQAAPGGRKNQTIEGIVVGQKVLDTFPNLGPYLEMLNKAVSLEDQELIDHISAKIALLLDPAGQLAEMGTGTEA